MFHPHAHVILTSCLNCHTINHTPRTSMQPLLNLISCFGKGPGSGPGRPPLEQLSPQIVKKYAQLEAKGQTIVA